MALPPKTDEAFLREVDEELRRDKLAGFWTNWGIWVAIGVVAALAALAGFLYWQHHNGEAAGVEGEQLQAAYDSLGANNAAAASKPLAELAKSNHDGYRALALFTQADVLLQKDDLKGAAAKLGAIAADTSLAKPFRDLALVRQTSAEFDTLKPQVIVERLRPLAVPGGPWLGSAGEMVAISYLRLNQRQQAGALFGQIARDTGVPETIRQRAVQMAGVLGVDAVPSAGASAGPTARVIARAASNEDTKAQ
ncbi:tetratricopeptide repeat protein [Sphingomonas sp. UV9]|uniref:tetratricopeptide repeat protein n=1 Tax=Sphingomonas sp. UV9 TaxID=1851410 RepID=UPI000FFB7CAD|nr:tetratricopeptide repeat protein [Sphingomonas sp. UV9]RXD05668.1 tetratricopeptide repeat protein [Sphingomonas sp. UV9]